MRAFLLLFFFGYCYLYSFQTIAQNVMLQFQDISFEDGISDSRVGNVIQDKEGFVWLTSRLGIDKYNGQTMKSYQFLQEKQAEINTLIQSDKGNILVATTRGLYFLNTEKDKFDLWQSQDSVLNNHLDSNIHTINQLKDGKFICSSATGFVFTLSFEERDSTTTHQFLKFPNGSTENYGTALFQDKNEVVWMGTSRGDLWVYKGDGFKPTSFTKSNNKVYINDIVVDEIGEIWIGTNGNGLFQYNPDLHRIKHYMSSNSNTSQSINNNMILCLYADTKNNIWIGTDGGGLNLYSKTNNKFSYFQSDSYSKYSISDNAILDISPGQDNVIWTGTVHGGISYFKNNMTLYNIPPSKLGIDQKDKQESRILQANDGDLWLTAGRNGLRRYNPKTGKLSLFTDNPEDESDLSGSNILSLYEDDQGRIWIGTLYGGLNIFNPKTDKFLKAEDWHKPRAIFTITQDKDDYIWVGSNTGIVVYNADLKIIEKYDINANLGLTSNVITSFYKDVKDEMWIGTAAGLNVFQQGRFKSYLPIQGDSNSISGSRILSIAEDDNLSVLIGTNGYGLNRYIRSSDTFKRIGKKEGLEATFIRGILQDDEKNIWCSTNLGLSKISPDGNVMNFNTYDGITPFKNSKASYGFNGYIYTANSFGLTYFKANDLTNNHSLNPNVFFTNISLINKKGIEVIPFKNYLKNELEINQLILPADNVMLTLGFATSNYWDPKKNTYTYKLDGFHKQWQTIGNQQILTFSNLKPGDYRLQIKALNNEGIESTHIASLNITALPSFWEKPWVIRSLFLLGIAMVFGLFKWRMSFINFQKRKLELMVKRKTELVETQTKKIYKNNLDLLNAEKANQELSQRQLENELNFKTDELTNHTLREIHKNKLLSKIKNDIAKEAKQNNNNNNLKAIVNLIDDSLNLDKDWDDFYNLFQQVHPSFISNLKKNWPNISDRELKLCALIRLNFSSQHIATLFGISESSIKVARHRLRKKLEIEENQSFQDFFERLMLEVST
ncbi:hypothetical protein FF125_09210 [Aureibaculum algae]|uniref:HTH luxR-type domain-containing protein n=1 Tax=Aureibaculum algae TaxID=2584122 RepID=A0A5B7TTD8_9FLAO|nr:two-component regulator propeller domain-containing protein [Aureibaculum algae]QCX38601.1 hypothetical protein FF125_09210 [Aureibaculum algae]